MDAAELLIHVHRMKERLIKPSLELVRDDEEPILIALEHLGRLRFRKTIQPGLGVIVPCIVNRPGESHQGFKRAVVIPQIAVHLQFVPDGLLAGTCHNHGLCLSVDPVLDLADEVLEHDRHLLGEGLWMQVNKGLE